MVTGDGGGEGRGGEGRSGREERREGRGGEGRERGQRPPRRKFYISLRSVRNGTGDDGGPRRS